MPKPTQIRTPEGLRAEATEHFDLVAERPGLFELTQDEALRQAQLGKLIVEAGLALAADEVFDLGDWFEAHAPTESDKRLAIGTMPYISGDALRLLSMEFAHPDIGVLPIDEVRAVLYADAPHVYQGVELTKANVLVQYRRLPL